MLNLRVDRFLIILAVLAGLAFAAAPASAGDFDDFIQEVTGPLTVDDVHGTATVGDQILFVSPLTHLTLDGQVVDFQTLADHAHEMPGMPATARYVLLGADAYAVSIRAGEGVGEEAEVTGILIVFDLGELSIGIIPDGETDPVLLGLDLATEFGIDVAEVSLELLLQLLQPGQSIRVRAHYDPNSLIATRIEFLLAMDEATGTVQSVNRRAGTMIVQKKRGGSLNLKLLPGTLITGPNGPVSLAQLRPGARVEVSFFTSHRKRVAPRVRITRAGR